MEYQVVPRSSIVPSPLNPRKLFDVAKLQELAASMANGVGIIEPLVVRPLALERYPSRGALKGELYEVVAGERRWRAAELAKLANVPVVVKELSDAQVLEIMVIENNQREDITPLEEATGFQMLLKLENAGNGDAPKLDVETLAQRLGRSKKYVYDRIKLLALIPEAQDLLGAGRITAGHAILLARLTPEQQKVAIDPNAGADYGDDGLFRYADGPVEDDGPRDAKGKKKPDPYRGMELAPVRSFQAWIRDNCRLNLGSRETQEDFPELAGAIEKAAAVVHITHHYGWESGGDEAGAEKDAPKIYDVQAWKRADGKQQSKKCPAAVTGVVVVGRERGTAFAVCIDKACKVHWPPAPKAQAQRGSSRPSAAAQKAAKKREEAARAKIERENQAWEQAIPAVTAALVSKMASAKPAVLGDIVMETDYINPDEFKKAAGLLKSKKDDAPTVLQRLALGVLLEKCDVGVHYMRQLAPLAKRLGVNVQAIVTKVQTSARAAEKKDAAAGAKKKAPKSKAA